MEADFLSPVSGGGVYPPGTDGIPAGQIPVDSGPENPGEHLF